MNKYTVPMFVSMLAVGIAVLSSTISNDRTAKEDQAVENTDIDESYLKIADYSIPEIPLYRSQTEIVYYPPISLYTGSDQDSFPSIDDTPYDPWPWYDHQWETWFIKHRFIYDY